MEIWIVVEINTYGDEESNLLSREYAGLKVCKSRAERDEEIERIDDDQFAEYRIETVTI